MSVTLYHNPRCSKSRATLALLEARNLEVELRLYLEQGPSLNRTGAVASDAWHGGCSKSDAQK